VGSMIVKPVVGNISSSRRLKNISFEE